MADVIIVGGGLAGLVNALLLSRAGLLVTVIEKRSYPFHRVCGEYISNEVLPFLESIGVDVFALGAARIHRLRLTSWRGTQHTKNLDLGGFGISRYTLDHHLYQQCMTSGVRFALDTQADDIQYDNGVFTVVTRAETFTAPLVIGAFGKRSNLDNKLKRRFFTRRSPYVGIKMHARIDLPDDMIQLNTFSNGYCGMSKIEGDRYCVCSLSHRDDLRRYGSIEELQAQVFAQNPYQKAIYDSAEWLYDKPEVINEVSFEKKELVHGHILMSGDTAGMIAPLCGNGMTMAMHSARLLSAAIIKYYRPGKPFVPKDRQHLENAYKREWNRHFAMRLWFGRRLQSLFDNKDLMHLAIKGINVIPGLSDLIIKGTHGKPWS